MLSASSSSVPREPREPPSPAAASALPAADSCMAASSSVRLCLDSLVSAWPFPKASSRMEMASWYAALAYKKAAVRDIAVREVGWGAVGKRCG